MKIRTTGMVVFFAAVFAHVFCSASQAQGLMPVPDITGAAVESESVLVSGSAWGGQYEYRYTVSSPANAVGNIWLLKVDVSAEERKGASTLRVKQCENKLNLYYC